MKTLQLLRNRAVPPAQVLLLKADINYTELHFVNGEVLVLARTLKSLHDDFKEYGFVRVSKSNMVNLNFLSKMGKNYATVTLKNDLKITVSRRQRRHLKTVMRSKEVA